MNEDRQIIVNQIRTPDGTVLQSRHRHDYVTYEDNNGQHYSVDGGTDYLRRGYDIDDYEEISLYSDSPFEELREGIYRGGRGKDGKQPLTYVKLSDMNTPWIFNTIIYYMEREQEFDFSEDLKPMIEKNTEEDWGDRKVMIQQLKFINEKRPSNNIYLPYYIKELEYRADNNIFIED